MSVPTRDDPMRWRLYEGIRKGDAFEGPMVDGPPVAWGESFEVMPVSEHEALKEAAEAVFDAAGQGDDALGDALIALGLVLADDR